MHKTSITVLMLINYIGLFAQTTIRLDSAIVYTLKNHPLMQLSQQEIEEQKASKKGSFNLQNPDVFIESPTTTRFTVGVQQTIEFPLVYIQQSKVAKQNIGLAEKGMIVNKVLLIRDVKIAYLNLQFAEIKINQLTHQDSIFNALYLAAERRYNAGEANLLEKVSAEAKSKEMYNILMQAKTDFQNAQLQLKLLAGIKDENIKADETLTKTSTEIEDISIAPGYPGVIKSSPFLQYYQQNISLNKQSVKLERSKLAPGLMVGYLNQGDANSEILYRYQFGLSIPIWFWTYSSQIKAAKIRFDMANSQYALAEQNLNSEYLQAVTEYKKYTGSINYFETSALKQAETIISTASGSYNAGQISYITYMQSLNQAFEIKMNYYETVRNYNLSTIELNYLKGQP
ncbi:MAG: TolC family protein [Cytophagales bacterium]|nr:TolC family protein [Cytophagales bacterium]